MRNVRIVALVVAACVVVALGVGAARAATEEEEEGPADAEEAAEQLLEAMQQGDTSTFLDLLDLKALYYDIVGEDAEERWFWNFVKDVREAVKAEFEDGPVEGFEYEVVGTMTVVRVRFRLGEDSEWQEHQIALAEDDGAWKVTVEGMHALDFGFGHGGPISRHAEDVRDVAEMVFEAFKNGDVDGVLDRMDFVGMYESIPEEYRPADYDKWLEDTREDLADDIEPEEGADYKILDVEMRGDDEAVVTVQIKERADDDWDEEKLVFVKIDGRWMLSLGRTGDEMME